MKYLVNGGCFGCSNCDYAFGLGYQGAIRQDTLARKVFIILPDSITESILYDFTQNVGDTLNSILSDFCYPDIISSIDSILIGNTYHRRINTYATGCNNTGTQFIEGIGSDKGLIESTMWFEIGSILICATHNGQTIYPDTTTFCPVIVGVVEIIKNELKLTVYPNPFLDYFEINLSKHLDEAVISIYNLWGQEVSTSTFHHTDQTK